MQADQAEQVEHTEPDGPTAYAWLDFNAPLSVARADRLAKTLAAGSPSDALDLGCGWGELLLRLLAAAPACTGTGVDTDQALLERARGNATARGLTDRARFVAGEAAEHGTEPADVVLCVGSSHAFGGTAEALDALHQRTRPGGRVLFGEVFWESPPTVEQAASLDSTPDELASLPELVDLTIAAGFRPLRIESANRDEWEAFESGFLADWEHWLVSNGDRPEAEQIRAQADEHRQNWLRGYRDVLGFAYLTLSRSER
jgi:cyclopropane fatty-acyl-phospholipid synthase-like methyltransferase